MGKTAPAWEDKEALGWAGLGCGAGGEGQEEVGAEKPVRVEPENI